MTLKAGLWHREGEAGYLLAEWLMAMGIFVLFISMVTIPSFSDWNDNQSVRQGAAEMYLAMHRVQNATILSNGRDSPSFTQGWNGYTVDYNPESFGKTHHIHLPEGTRFSGEKLLFRETGVRANGSGSLRLGRQEHGKAYLYIVARSTGRIRMEKER